jgi:lysophospholipase L1-like esterase
MSNPYLLTASLLAASPLSVPPPPKLPPSLPESLSALLAASATQALQPLRAPKATPDIEQASPEFSSPPSVAVEAVATPALRIPTSGSQLYRQRLAALKAGKTHTRLPADSFYSDWAKGTKQPTHEQWKHLLAQEARAMAKGQGNNRLSILVGDSLSLWFPSQSLPQGQFWLNQGISGENTQQILQRLSTFSQTRPDTIYVMAGTNDLRQGISDRAILNNLQQILRHLRQTHPQARVIVQSILPTRLPAIPNQRIQTLNQHIAAIAQQEGCNYLNLYPLFTNAQDQLRRDLTTDGIHLTLRGYHVWQGALQYTDSVMVANR